MVERTPIFDLVSQILLALGLLTALAPFAVVLIAATQDLRTVNMVPMPLIPGPHLWDNLSEAWSRVDFGGKMLNSFVFATGVALGLLTALAPFAVVLIAATQDLRTVNMVPMPLIPGPHLWENLSEAWSRVDFGGK